MFSKRWQLDFIGNRKFLFPVLLSNSSCFRTASFAVYQPTWRFLQCFECTYYQNPRYFSSLIKKKFRSPASAEETGRAAFTPLPSIVSLPKPKIDAMVHMLLIVLPDICMCLDVGCFWELLLFVIIQYICLWLACLEELRTQRYALTCVVIGECGVKGQSERIAYEYCSDWKKISHLNCLWHSEAIFEWRSGIHHLGKTPAFTDE